MLNNLKKWIKKISNKLKYRNKINYPSPLYIHKKVNLNNVKFEKYCQVAHHAEINDSQIGQRTSVGRYTKIQSASIGRFCSISWECTIGATSHPYDRPSSHAFSYRKMFGLVSHDVEIPKQKVMIGHDVWIGCDVIIMPGIKIGNGAVIGAGSVVTKDVEDYGIYVGNPAREIKKRFNDETIEKLEKIQWWNWSDDKIKENISFFQNDLTEKSIKEFIAKGENNV